MTGQALFEGSTTEEIILLWLNNERRSPWPWPALRESNDRLNRAPALRGTLAKQALHVRHPPLVETLLFALILTVAAIPVALPAVLSVTMAVGAEHLARLKAIVSRLVAIEELAGIDILCCDKTVGE